MEWQTLGAIQPTTLTEARVQAHFAAQRVSAPATVLLNEAPDWSHTTLSWDHAHQALVSHTLPSGTRLGLRMPDLAMIELRDDSICLEYELAGRSNSDLDAFLAAHFEAHGLSREKLAEVRYRDMPDHLVADDGPYDPNGLASEFQELAHWYRNADRALEIVRDELASVQPGPSPVYCWPHHFDIATLIAFDDADSEVARAIGVGMSPGDSSYPQPYFYVNPWPKLDVADLPTIPEPGRWHTEGFIGAVATGERIIAQGDQPKALMAFLREAIGVSRTKLGV